ncbi:MAG: hypothetical protein JXB49_02610 [Bacteroidales bacterium]|nr:hypothetical protein [Bacteroidales bacterium]
MDNITPHDTYLSNEVTITGYLQMEEEKNKDKIIEFIKTRFTERFITPLRCEPRLKHGFCTMAICCLMIETLESFWRGWDNSRSRSEQAFCSFFDRNNNLGSFYGYITDFYKNVRCGILHQAETMNGWHIRRDGPLFTAEIKTINATSFHNEMEVCLNFYCSSLERSDWDSEIWVNFRNKMKAIITNCRTKD